MSYLGSGGVALYHWSKGRQGIGEFRDMNMQLSLEKALKHKEILKAW